MLVANTIVWTILIVLSIWWYRKDNNPWWLVIAVIGFLIWFAYAVSWASNP